MNSAKHLIHPFQESKALRTTYGETLVELGKDNKDIVVLDADLSTSTNTSIFRKAFPTRHFDMGIAEADMIGTAAGMAAAGLVPSPLLRHVRGGAYLRPDPQCHLLRRSAAKIVATHAGITVGEDGGSHQMIEDIAMMRVVPNMSVLVPATRPRRRR
jgi:transketolase